LRFGKWETIREISSGGQGTVYLAFDSSHLDIERLLGEFREILDGLRTFQQPETHQQNARRLLDLVEKYVGRESGQRRGAFKILHENARSDAKALGRLRLELEVLDSIRHPSLLPILDASPAQAWFVAPFFGRGSLASNLDRFAGQPERAIGALRPLVEGVAALHARGAVHRDIKPENVFLSDDGLVLGDFGIVWFEDHAHTRLSDTYEKVGSSDWMPGWAMSMRLDDVTPAFDVFSLGKLLWAMVSGRTKMPLWYFDRPEFDLTRQFPGDERMQWINRLLMGSVREHKEQVWQNAGEFLKQLDSVAAILRRGGQVVSSQRYCRVCGQGIYRVIVLEGRMAALNNLGFRPSNEQLRVFECPECGHLDLFRFTQPPPAWQQ
jgi:serine/threonine protein kinase